MKDRYLDQLSLARTWADRAARHEFEFFGRVHHYPEQIPWQHDPVSRRPWPSVFCADALGPNSERDCGDVKDVCELSRQHFLVDLGKSYYLEGTSEHAAEIRRLVRSWIAGNPYATGINWASPLEPAYRTFSWLWAYYFTLDDPDFGPSDHLEWLRAFLDNGRFLHRHLELYASPYNHLIGEATALYLLGTLFPEFREAAAWRARGRGVLEQRLQEQFHPDGGTVEQATLYHHATLGFYLLAALVARANGDELSPAVWAAIERAIEFSMLLVQPDGQLPAIGDTDDARPIQLERKPFFDFRAYQAIGAVLFERADFKAVAGRFHEDALWVLGVDALEKFDRLPAVVPDRTNALLIDSGYFVCRSDWTPKADYVCFDCGSQAGGLRTDEVPSAAHGHADCLSVVAFLGGQPFLVDSGFYTYNGDLAWERHFRGTGAHNTARVDGRDQARHHSKMAWSKVPTARVEHRADFEIGGYVAGSHDGFLEGSGIRHRRHVWYRSDGGYVVLFDDFEGTGEHEVEVNFHFAPGTATLVGDSLTTGSAGRASWVASFPAISTLVSGGETPDAGWVAPSLGVRTPAPLLRISGRMRQAGAGLLAVLTPVVCRVIQRPTLVGTLALSIDGDGWTDEVIARPTLAPQGTPAGPGLWISRHRVGAAVERFAAGRRVADAPRPPAAAYVGEAGR